MRALRYRYPFRMTDRTNNSHRKRLSNPLGEPFNDALVYAHNLHREQPRKGRDIPYIGHLLGVASLVLEAGGDEEMAIAALLHDAVEDQGGRPTLEEIRRRFGDRVAHMVEGCTDSMAEDPNHKEEWCDRKLRYIRHVIEESDADTRVVSAADKVHNARAILNDHHEHGDCCFDHFTQKRDGTLWYYRALVNAFHEAAQRRPDPRPGLDRLLRELERIVDELERRAGGPGVNPCHG